MAFSVRDLSEPDIERNLGTVGDIQEMIAKLSRGALDRKDWLDLSRSYKALAENLGKNHSHYTAIQEQKLTAREKSLHGWQKDMPNVGISMSSRDAIAVLEALQDGVTEAIESEAEEKIVPAKKSYALACRHIARMHVMSPQQKLSWAFESYRYDPGWESCLSVAHTYVPYDGRMEEQERKEAIRWGNKAIFKIEEDVNIKDPARAYYNAVFLFKYRLHEPAHAVTAILMGMKQNPSFAEAHYKEYYEYNPAKPDTPEQIREALIAKTDAEPENYLHRLVLGRYEEAACNNEESIAHYRKAYELAPEIIRPARMLVNALARNETLDRETLSSVLKAWNAVAMEAIHLDNEKRRDQFDTAIRSIEKAHSALAGPQPVAA